MKTNQSKYWMGIAILLSVVTLSNTSASNYVKIATIGAERPKISAADKNKDKDMQLLVNRTIALWDNHINRVLPDKPDLILLPELSDFPIGLTKEEQYAYLKVRNNQVIDHFSAIAKANNCYIAFGTMRVDKDENFLNSAILLDRKGKTAGIYEKNFPTIGEVERGVKPGNEAPVFECDFGTVAFAICFDLNFEELRRQYEETKPDIILFPSAYHGGHVQANWAYLCRSFFVGSMCINRIPSEIRNPLGEVIASTSNYNSFKVTTINLDSRVVHLGYNFGKLRDLKKKYGEVVTISDPGRLGAVLVSSESEEFSVDSLIEEFDIELIDDYFNRSRKVAGEALIAGKKSLQE